MTADARLTRRTALASAALVPLGLTACDIDPPRDDESSGSSRGPQPTPHEDSALVGSLVTAIAGAEALVSAARDAVPALSGVLDPLLGAHAEHRELLAAAAPDAAASAPPAGGVPGGRAAALAAVRRVELRLQRRVERGCVQASSGDLARVLASIAGSLSQHAVTLVLPPAQKGTP